MEYARRRFELIDVSYAAARGLLLWLMLLNPGIVGLAIAGSTVIAFGTKYALTTPKDAQQDERMDSADRRYDEDQRTRAERRAESQAWNRRQDDELKELSDDVHQIFGWGAGAFASVTVLQIIGLLRKNRDG